MKDIKISSFQLVFELFLFFVIIAPMIALLLGFDFPIVNNIKTFILYTLVIMSMYVLFIKYGPRTIVEKLKYDKSMVVSLSKKSLLMKILPLLVLLILFGSIAFYIS